MTYGDSHPGARRKGNPTEAWGGQFQNSVSAHSTGNGKHPSNPAQGNQYHVSSADGQIGRYEGANHDSPSTQAWGNQDPSSMLLNSIGYGNQTSNPAQGKSGKENQSHVSSADDHVGWYEGSFQEPPSTQTWGSQDPSAVSGHSSGHGNAYRGHGGSPGGVHDPPSTEARGSQDPSSMSVNSSAQGKSGKWNQSHVSSKGHGTADDQFRRYGNGYEGTNYDPPSIQAWGRQDPSSRYGNGYEEPASMYQGAFHEPPSTQEWGSQAPSSMSVDRSGYEKASSTPASDAYEHHQSHYGIGYDRQGSYKDPVPPTKYTGNQPNVSSTGYGTDYDHHSGYNNPIQKPPWNEVTGNQSHIYPTGYGTGDGRHSNYRYPPSIESDLHSGYKDPVPVLTPPPTQCQVSSTAYNTGNDRHGGYKDSSTGNQTRVSFSGYGAGDDWIGGYRDPQPTGHGSEHACDSSTGNQTHDSFSGYGNGDDWVGGYRDPTATNPSHISSVGHGSEHTRNLQPTAEKTHAPGSVGGSGYPVNALPAESAGNQSHNYSTVRPHFPAPGPYELNLTLQLPPAPAPLPTAAPTSVRSLRSTKPKNTSVCPCCSIL